MQKEHNITHIWLGVGYFGHEGEWMAAKLVLCKKVKEKTHHSIKLKSVALKAGSHSDCWHGKHHCIKTTSASN